MKDFISVSPLKILDQSSRRGLGPGNLGVLISRAGVGKTACLIHVALDRIFRGEKLIHVSLEEGPEKVTAYYNVIYFDLLKALNLSDSDEYRMRIDRNRMILAYLNRSFDLDRLENNLKNLAERLDFRPNTIIMDGLDFEKEGRVMLEGLKKTGRAFGAEIWLSALSHRHITETNERDIPYPCAAVDDLLSIIIQLVPEPSGIFLRLLKDHDKSGDPNVSVKLDPNTFLAQD